MASDYKLKAVFKKTPPKGKTPPHLVNQTQKFKKAAKECKSEINFSKLKGSERVRAMNECIKRKLVKKENE